MMYQTIGLLAIMVIIGYWGYVIKDWFHHTGSKWNRKFFLGGILWTLFCLVGIITISLFTGII